MLRSVFAHLRFFEMVCILAAAMDIVDSDSDEEFEFALYITCAKWRGSTVTE